MATALPSDVKKLKALEPENAKLKKLPAECDLEIVIRIFLAREGEVKSPSRAYRLWRKAKVQLPAKRRRQRLSSARPAPHTARAVNHVWASDFVFGACANGQQLIEILTRLMSERAAVIVPAFTSAM